MKKFLFIYFVFFYLTSAFAQKEINTEFASKMNFAFQPLEKIRVPFGLLKDQAFEFTELSAYNGVITDSNYVLPVTIKQIYNTLLSARIHSNASQFIQPDEYEQRWQTNRTQGVITLSGLLYNYAQFNPNALTSNKLQVINNQFKDKYIGSTWQNPYDTKQVFAIAPSVRKYKGYNLSIKFPANLWLTNTVQSVQNIQIDANDGLGYRNTTFGQNLSVAYTTSGLKSWKYKITLNNGQILYSHSKIIIEEGLITKPHIDSKGTTQFNTQSTTNSNALGLKNITATKDYNGSFGSAKVVIDYASADQKIRRPLIVAEGFDQGILTNPEDEFGITDYSDFIDIVNASNSFTLRSLVTIDDTQQYDIIWVDWNNGVDYIQKNAYVLQEVIKWVNDEKLANNSSQENVVFGASMGGLIARYALKDMEDNSLPTQTSLYISHDAPHQGANFPIGYQYMSRHALHQYVQSPLLLAGGEVILPLFTDGVTPLDYLLLQNTPAARQMLINYVGINYGITNTIHNDWQTELRLKGYPSMRKIAISNGNHCATTQNAPAGANLLSIDGNYSTGWLTDIVLTVFPSVNAGIFQSLSILTNEPGFLVGILPGGNKIKLDFKVNSLPNAGANQIYKGKITYTKKLLWLVNINVTITDKSFNSPSNTLPFDYYPGGAIETGIRNSATASGGSFWEQAFVKYKMNISTEPSFCFIPTASALDIGLGNVTLDNNDYLKKYNVNASLVTPKVSPFNNYITSYQNTFTLDFEDNFQSTNEHHIYLHLRNANWLAREIDNDINNSQLFDCSFICSNTSLSGPTNICASGSYSVPAGATSYIWSKSGSGSATLTSNGNTATLTRNGQQSGMVTITVRISNTDCSPTDIILSKEVWVGTLKYNSLSNVTSGLNQHISPLPANGCGTNGFEVNFWPSNDLVQEVQFEKITTDVFWHRDFATDTSRNVFLFPECNKPFQFKVRARNNCGWSEWFELSYTIESCPENCIPPFNGIIGTNFILAPNPVTNGTLNVSVKSDAPWFTVPGGGGDPSLDPGENGGGSGGLISNIRVSISIYNQLGILLQSFPSTLMPATLDISTLPAGSYLVVFQYMTQTESHTIIKQ